MPFLTTTGRTPWSHGQVWTFGDRRNKRLSTPQRPCTDKQYPTALFVRLFNVYRGFIEYFTVLAHPLNKLLKKGT